MAIKSGLHLVVGDRPRIGRLTYAFSKRWDVLEVSLALHFAHCNFYRIHDLMQRGRGERGEEGRPKRGQISALFEAHCGGHG